MSENTDKPVRVTTDTFEKEVVDSSIPVVVDFWAPWCGPCRAIGPVLEDLAIKWAGKVKVVKLNVDEEPVVANTFKVRSIPTLVAMRGRDVIDIQIGFGGKDKIEKLFTGLAA